MTIDNMKEYKTLDPSTKKAIDTCISRLMSRYAYYKNQNTSLGKLCGVDTTMIHEIIKKNFYVYKKSFRRSQVRLLYYITDDNKLDVINFYIKNNYYSPNKQKGGTKGTEYIRRFENYIDNSKFREVSKHENSKCSC